MTTYVGLLYSIGLPEGRRLVMRDLVGMAHELGLGAPRTMASTGNLIFECARLSPGSVEKRLEAAFERKFGKPVDIVVRDGAAWRKLAGANPFAGEGASDPKRIAVRVMRRPLAQSTADDLKRFVRDERLALVDGDLWIYFAGDPGRSKLLSAAARLSEAIGTFRTLNSVKKIEAML